MNGTIDQPKQLIQQMDSPIEQHAAAVFLQMTPIAWDAIGSLNTGFNLEDVPDRLVLIQLTNDQEIRVPPTILVNHKDVSGLFGNRQNLVELIGIHRYRLFADHMLTRPQSSDRDFFMRIIRCRNQNRFDVAIL
ncbi:hypothetical protein D3C81_1289480 [compost metagenome]